MYETIGFLNEIKLGRKLSKLRNDLLEILDLYRAYSDLKIELDIGKSYSTLIGSNTNILLTKEKEFMGILVQSVAKPANDLNKSYNELLPISERTIQKKKAKIKKRDLRDSKTHINSVDLC